MQIQARFDAELPPLELAQDAALKTGPAVVHVLSRLKLGGIPFLRQALLEDPLLVTLALSRMRRVGPARDLAAIVAQPPDLPDTASEELAVLGWQLGFVAHEELRIG
jgi:hypothetical protein